MSRSRMLALAVACLALAAAAQAASAKPVFHPRIGGGLGLIPPVNRNAVITKQDVASGAQIPETYHGGSVMSGTVTIHTIFWAPPGYAFQSQRPGAPHDYKGMVEQFFTDLAADSGHIGPAASNEFSVLPQFGQGQTTASVTPGSYSLSYNSGSSSDLILDKHPYPPRSEQCASPAGAATCLTDGQIQTELSREIDALHGSRGLRDLWLVFLPPAVDECILAGNCGTNVFGGYHSVSDLGQGRAIYSVVIDPATEGPVAAGADPQGYPDAEFAIDTAAHEVAEALTDPVGTGWVDPNGFEVGDKCEFGPQTGQPLGFAGPDNAPYNQLINGHKYLLQEEWANIDDKGHPDCVQHAKATSNPTLPLPQVYLTQYATGVAGNTERPGAFRVTAVLKRAAPDGSTVVVARGRTTSNPATGRWSVSFAPHAVGDDRDEIDINYGGPTHPANEVILTGNGGNPFTEAGWLGWFDLDNASFLTDFPPFLAIAPCFQTGVLSVSLNGATLVGSGGQNLNDFCDLQTDTTAVGIPFVRSRDVLYVNTLDNRAFSPADGFTPNPNGALVNLAVPAGEPDAVSQFSSPLPFFFPSGFPRCTGDLERRAVTCTGLVPGERYRLLDGAHRASAAANGLGVVRAPVRIRRGDTVILSNGSRTLSRLHLARLQVKITGEQSLLSGGRCQPGEYYGRPITSPPTSTVAGFPTFVAGGAALTGEICPLGGNAARLSASNIAQTDERSGGQTQTEVPHVQSTSPIDGEGVDGTFTALADSGLPGPNNSIIPTDATSKIALKIRKASGGRTLFHASNVDTNGGVQVAGLKPGSYRATWVLTDANGDTRTVTTRFVEEKTPGSPGHKPRVSCHRVKHNRISCTVMFSRAADVSSGTLRMRISRGGRVAALGHGLVRNGVASLALHERQAIPAGRWSVTLVLTQPGTGSSTIKTSLSM